MKEYQLQKAVCKYLDLQGYLYCATMGGQYQKYHSQRNKAKATGYKRGIPDIIIYEPVKKYQSDKYWHGLALELKEYIAEVCYDLDTAISIVETYMSGYIK